MKSPYFKTLFSIFVAVMFVLFYQRATAAALSARLLKATAGSSDTTKIQKPGRLKKAKKIKKDNDELEDGVDDDIRARAHQEFLQRRDPKLNRVPLERLLVARQKRDQFLNNVKVRVKNVGPQGNVVKPSGNPLSPTPPPPASPTTISGMQWQERGPNNVGGRTRALIFDMGDAAHGYKRVFAGGVGGGLWVTNDITASPVQWTKINDFFDNIAISCIAQNPVNPLEIYAGTGEGFLNADAIQGLGVWKSSDGGATWTHLTSTVGFKFINAILVDKNGSVYIAGESDIFVGFGVDQSTDGGNSWTNVISSSEAGADLQLAANGDVYASTGVIYLYGHIYVSDFGVNGAHTGNAGTWTNITPSATGVITPATTNWNRIKLALAPGDANIVYAFFEADYGSTGNLKLTSVQQYNRSANAWTVKTVPTEAFSNGQSWYSIAAAVDPNNSGVLYAGSLDAEISTDGGLTWTQDTHWNYPTTNSVYVHADHHAYVYAPGSSSELIMGTDGGVFYSTNANGTPTFTNKNNGYNVTQFYSVALHPTNLNYALAGAQDNGSQIFTSAGVGPTSVATGGDGADVFIDQTNGNIQVTSYVYDQYYVSTNNGASFNGLGHYGQGQFINPTAYDPSTKSLYAGSASGYYYRAENILSPVYNEVAVPAFAGANVSTVAVSPLTANRVYFGLDNGSVVRVDNAQTGTSLTGVVLAPALGSAVLVSCVNVDATNEDHILVTYSNYGVTHIIETKNASAATPTWTNVSGNLPDMPVRWALFYPGDPTKAIIATELGVWSTDLINGTSTTWDPTNTGLANVEVDMLTYRATDGTIAAATHGRGVFTANLQPILATSGTLAALNTKTGTASSSESFSISGANLTGNITVTAPAGFDVSPNNSTWSGSAGSCTVTTTGTLASTLVYVRLDAGDAVNTYSGDISISGGGATAVTEAIPSSNVIANLSSDATLSNLTINTGFLTPSFSPGVTSYTRTLANSVATVTVVPTAHDAGATIQVNGTTLASGSTSGSIPVSVGSNTITVLVTAADGVTTKTYTITVTRAPSTNANLSGLHPSAGTLSPAFAGIATTSYSETVAATVNSITITPTTAQNTSTVTVNGIAVTSGSPSGAIALNTGANTIAVTVTAQDGTTMKIYTITVGRGSTNDNLSALKLSSGTLSPTFAGTTTTSYTASLANTVSSITVTPTTAQSTSTVTVNGMAVTSGSPSGAIAMNVGTNTLTVTVTAQDGTDTKIYTVTVTRAASNNNNLSALKLSTGALSPGFAGTTISNYTAIVPGTVGSITVTPTTAQNTATVTVNGTSVNSGSPSGAIILNTGANPVTVTVTAQDGSTKTYTVTVGKGATGDNLSGLAISSGTLSPAFSPGTTSGYTASVPNSVSSITVTPTTAQVTSTVTVNGSPVTSGTASNSINLVAGGNTTITTTVTAQNGVSSQNYTITITRGPSSDASLTNLQPSAGTLSPAFAAGTTSYSTSVPSAVTTIAVTPTTTDAGATVTVNGTPVSSGAASANIGLPAGNTTITTIVTAQDGSTTQTYTLTVFRPSANANLSGLHLSNGAVLSPAFAGVGTTSYTASVANTVKSITVTPTTAQPTSTVKVNGAAVSSGTASGAIALSIGANTVNAMVTAQDGTTVKTYTVTVTRASGLTNIPDVAMVDKTVDNLTPDDIITVHLGLSPNGDGINDFLQIDGILAYPDNMLTIINRNGTLIYKAKNYDNQTKVFNGHSSKTGAMQQPGTYFYSLEYTVKGLTKHKTGFIVLKY